MYSRQIEDTNIWRAELPKSGDPPARAELFISSTRVDQTPKYSPDGKKIAFIILTVRLPRDLGFEGGWLESRPHDFFGGPMVGHPSWSPDGQWITFHARPEGTTDVFVIPAAGGPPKRLTTNTWEDHYPTYSRDGRSIFFSSRRSGEMQIWRMPAEGGRRGTDHYLGWSTQCPSNRPMARQLFYHLLQDPGEIWSIPVQGGRTSKDSRTNAALPGRIHCHFRRHILRSAPARRPSSDSFDSSASPQVRTRR